MNSLFGFKGRGFTLIASDMTLSNSVIRLLHDDHKHYTIWNKVSIGYNGEPGSSHQLLSYAREKLKFENIRNKIPVTAQVTANIIQKSIHSSLRSAPFSSGCLVGDQGSLFAVDMYGAVWEADYACLGYAQYFLYGILDKDWKREIGIDESVEIVKKCVFALKDKFVLGSTKYSVRIVSDSGIEERVVEAE